ncbi:hypothetical protein FN846DRAFT_213262 [Sphaerosporella brunnea]|uniref:Transmembrane protein n=1 Tax=Sphaerosporella brunnea TaxID=1250544 RepID=A0A5J5EP55_9PEZI|nr:hypothetical protein FN846DRAFT_213262 [Sphaerosporella brunnea]
MHVLFSFDDGRAILFPYMREMENVIRCFFSCCYDTNGGRIDLRLLFLFLFRSAWDGAGLFFSATYRFTCMRLCSLSSFPRRSDLLFLSFFIFLSLLAELRGFFLF